MNQWRISTFKSIIVLLILIMAGCNSSSGSNSKSGLHSAPLGEELSKDFTVEVNGQSVDVYLARLAQVENPDRWMLQPENVGVAYSFTYFDLNEEITVKVTSLNKPLDQLEIRPFNADLKFQIHDNTVTFTLREPCKLSIEPDGRREPLLIFANPPESDRASANNPNRIYFGPGIHKPGRIDLTSGQELYIAEGAIVKAGISVTGENIKIGGRGILCGNDWEWRKGPGSMIRMENASNVIVEDIILRGSWGWTIPIYNCDSVAINNVKLVGGKNPNDDGINPCNSQRVYIRDCFIRSDDDCIAVKGIRLGSDNDNVEDIIVEDCIFWADRARVFLLGHESRAPYMRNISLRNLDILHFNMTPFLVEPGEEMSIENLTIENVTLHADYPAQGGAQDFDLIRLTPTVNQYMDSKVPGRISNVTLNNISLTGEEREGAYPIVVEGAGPDHLVSNITLNNIRWFGHLLDENSPQVKIGSHAEDIHFSKGEVN